MNLSLLVTREGDSLISVEVGDVETVQVERLHGREELHLTFRHPRIEMMRLVMKSAVSIHWRVLRSIVG